MVETLFPHLILVAQSRIVLKLGARERERECILGHVIIKKYIWGGVLRLNLCSVAPKS
jgi:hypothetical protein